MPHLDVSEVLEAWLSYVLLQIDIKSLFGGSSRKAQLLVYSWLKNSPPLLGKVILLDWAHSYGKDEQEWWSGEGDTYLASQIATSVLEIHEVADVTARLSSQPKISWSWSQASALSSFPSEPLSLLTKAYISPYMQTAGN